VRFSEDAWGEELSPATSGELSGLRFSNPPEPPFSRPSEAPGSGEFSGGLGERFSGEEFSPVASGQFSGGEVSGERFSNPPEPEPCRFSGEPLSENSERFSREEFPSTSGEFSGVPGARFSYPCRLSGSGEEFSGQGFPGRPPGEPLSGRQEFPGRSSGELGSGAPPLREPGWGRLGSFSSQRRRSHPVFPSACMGTETKQPEVWPGRSPITPPAFSVFSKRG